jgi:ABC-type glutathione transport system ATPase component
VVLVLRGVRKGFALGGQGWVSVLEDVSMEVAAGEVAAIVGGRLAGKTTLLELVAGTEEPDAGTVELAGGVLTGLSRRRRERLLGDVTIWMDRYGPAQESVKVWRFVGWPLASQRGRRYAERRAVQMLERVGARECSDRCWGELSNWQRMLVGLARAFAGSPRVVVLDDLLDALGTPGTEEASDLLRSLMDEADPPCAVLMSASDLDSAMFADRIWTLRRGKLTPLAGHQTHDNDADIIPLRARKQDQ